MAVAAAMCCAVSCGRKTETPAEGSRIGFALSFFKAVNSSVPGGENVVASPYSAGVALSMLTEGADGQTKVEIDNALNGCLFVSESLSDNDTVIVKSANSVWISDNFSVRNRYVDHMEKDFKAEVEVMNFADPSTVQAMNNWCSENTEGKIKKIKEYLSQNDVMVLVNALYFNAPWENAFNADLTHDDVFHGLNGDAEVRMMYRKGTYDYVEYQGCQIIRLPYAGGRYSMYVALPPAGMTPGSVLPYVGESLFKMALGMLKPAEVKFYMPKVKLETSMNLNKTLERMGVRTAFSTAADFDGISVSGPLLLSEVAQKCYIDITEQGTEAAAVTAATVALTSVRPSIEYKVMKVDRPYIFFIADMENENILFTGTISNL